MSSIILFLLFSSINLKDSLVLILDASLIWLSFALSIIIILRFVLAYRWKIILDYQKINFPLIKLVKLNYLASSVGQILPGGLGGDLIRGYELNKKISKLLETSSSIVFDRIVGVLSMIFLAVCASLFAEYLGFSLKITNVLLFTGVFFIIIFLISVKIKDQIKKKINFKSQNIQRKFNKLLKIFETITDVKMIKFLFPKIFTLSIIVQVLRAILFYYIFASLNIYIDFIYFLIFIPIVLAVTILPISIGGLGVREGVLVFFFGLVGINPEICISAGLIFQVLQFLISIPGLALWALPIGTK